MKEIKSLKGSLYNKVKHYKNREKIIKYVNVPLTLLTIILTVAFNVVFPMLSFSTFTSTFPSVILVTTNVLIIHDWIYDRKECIEYLKGLFYHVINVDLKDDISDYIIEDLRDMEVIPMNLKFSEDLSNNNIVSKFAKGYYVIAGSKEGKQLIIREIPMKEILKLEEENEVSTKQIIESQDFALLEEELEYAKNAGKVKNVENIKRLILK